MSGTSGVCRCATAFLKPDVAALVTTRRLYFGVGDLERGRCARGGLIGRFVILCGRMGSGRVMVVSSGEDGMEITEEFRRRIVAVEAAEDLLRVKEVVRGNRGRFGADGVVGVSIGDCCWSCILNAAFVLSYGYEDSGDRIRSNGLAMP
jgi:hypothetical protein